MKRAYKYKLKPTYKQKSQLQKAFGSYRFVYNWGLNEKIKAWTNEHKNLTYFDLAKKLSVLKKTNEYKWLNDVSAESLQQSLRNLDNAYTNFFKAKKGFPKFKSKKNHNESVKYVYVSKIDFNNWKIKIPKCKWVKICKNKKFDTNGINLLSLTVTKDKCGEYWCSILVEDNNPLKSKAKILEETAIGIDLGIRDYAILSDGTKFSNPKYLEKHQKKLSSMSRKFSKTIKGSKRREIMRLKIAKQYRNITNMRKNFIHNITAYLIKNYDTICLENLNIEGMIKNHHLANSIHSASWGEFIKQLKYKAELNGKNIVFIGRFEPSSKTCNKCGYINKELKLNDRKWICPICGEHHDRDINAAINIKKFALNPQSLVAVEEKVENITDRR